MELGTWHLEDKNKCKGCPLLFNTRKGGKIGTSRENVCGFGYDIDKGMSPDRTDMCKRVLGE